MRRRLIRTLVSLAVVVGAVAAFRWTIRTALTREHAASSAVSSPEMPYVPAPRTLLLANIVPQELHVNVVGVELARRSELLHTPYSLAVDIADGMAESAGWERMDDEEALTLRNLSGMNRLYRRPDGTFVLRSLHPLEGDETQMDDLEIPESFAQGTTLPTRPEDRARSSAMQVRAQLPEALREVVVGSPLITELVGRGGGATFIVRTIADVPPSVAHADIMDAARRTGWRDSRPASALGHPEMFPLHYEKQNLAFDFDINPLPEGGCSVNYRFTDDEVLIPNERNLR